MFYQGSLQDGINLAIREAKAVICFVRDDTETSLQWEREYFGDDEFPRSLGGKAVILRLTAGSQEAGFLTSFCPITKVPAVVVIKNGTLREYFVPEVEKGDFRSRIMAAVDDKPSRPVNQTPQSQNEAGANVTGGVSASAAAPAAVAEPAAPFPSPAQPGQDTRAQQPSKQQRDESIRAGKRRMERMEPKRDNAQRTIAASSEKARQPKVEQVKDTKDAEQVKVKDTQKQKAAPTAPGADSPASNTDSSQVRQKPTPTLPKQYRLQVRLFDGSTVRSSFSPSQTIRKDVRSWLDGQLPDETQPYNLKHILTPLPNRTLSVPEEDKTLEDLRLGPSANLVMVPVPSYSEAYASTSSPPVRAVSSVFNLAYSAASAVGEMTSSFLGYGQTASESTEGGPANTAPSSTNSDGAQRSHPAPTGGPIIRTLRDHREGRDDSQLYNGNQLNFEPRKDSDGRSG